MERADLFLKNLQQRRRTIQRIAEAILELQQGFLETGQRAFLRPLTRTGLAQRLDLHESTVSRALLHKYVQLPSQEVVSFDVFFENAVSAKDIVAGLIAEESADAPLSDQAIADDPDRARLPGRPPHRGQVPRRTAHPRLLPPPPPVTDLQVRHTHPSDHYARLGVCHCLACAASDKFSMVSGVKRS